MGKGSWASLARACAILVSTLAAPVQANEPAPKPETAPQVAPAEPQAQPPQLPPGLFVWPRQPQAAPVPPADPGGCTYRENKLDLLV